MFELFGPFWLGLVVLGWYLYREKILRSGTYEVQSYQKASFYIALFLIYFFYGSPFSVLADTYLFSALMSQAAFTYFIIMPLLIISFPFELYKKYTWNYRNRLFLQIVGHPWLTLVIFTVLFSVYFVPTVFNFVHEHIALVLLYHFVLFVYAFFMWWAILNPVRRINELSPLYRIAYIFLASLALMPIGFFHLLNLNANYVLYFPTEAMIIPQLTNIYDQQLAGGILKLIQLSSFIFVMYRIVKAWALRMQKKDGDPLDENLRVVQGVGIRTNESKK